MADWLSSINLTTEVGFGFGPYETVSAWIDISTYVRGIPEVFHGRTSEHDDIGPSTLTMVLSNRDRRFDSDYASSPYTGDLVPMTPIKVTAALGVTTVLLFSGFVESWPQEWDPVDGTSTITATSAHRLLSNTPLAESAYAARLLTESPYVYLPMQATEADVWPNLGSTPNARVIDSEALSPLSTAILGESALTQDIGAPLGSSTAVSVTGGTTTIDGSPYTNAAGGIVSLPSYSELRSVAFWVYPNAPTGTPAVGGALASAKGSTTQNLTAWVATDPSGNAYLDKSYSNTADNRRDNTADIVYLGPYGRLYHVVLATDTTNMYTYVNNELRQTQTLTVGTSNYASTQTANTVMVTSEKAATGTSDVAINHVSFHTSALTAGDVTALYLTGLLAFGAGYNDRGGARIGRILDEIGFPAAARTLSTGKTIHGPYLPDSGDAMERIREVERAEQGIVYIAADGDVVFRDRQWMWTDADSGVIISDDGTAGDVHFASMVVDGATVESLRNSVTTSYGGVGGVTQRDTTSSDRYGKSHVLVEAPTITTSRQASRLSEYVVREGKDPRSRVTSVDCAIRQPTTAQTQIQFDDLLQLSIGQTVTIQHTPLGVGTQVVRVGSMQGVQHRITSDQWYVTLYLSPAPTDYNSAPYLTLGDATYGKIGAAFGNMVPF